MMARAPGPADDKRNAAVDHVDKNFKNYNGKWYSKATPGRPGSYEEAVTVVQACLLLGLPVTAEASSAVLAELAKRVVDLTDRIAALEAPK